MSENQPTSFEECKEFLNDLISEETIYPASYMGALASAQLVGKDEAQGDSSDLGVTRYANEMIELFNQAEQLNQDGRVRPPFSYEQTSHIITQKDILSALTDANADQGPTDTGSMDTTDRK